MVLADSSVWVAFLRHGRRGPAAALAEVLRRDEAAMCGQVAAELVAGAREPDQMRLWTLLSGIPWGGLGRPQWLRVGQVAGLLRRRGATVPLTDVEIAVVAVNQDWELWTWDSDFTRIREALPELRLRSQGA